MARGFVALKSWQQLVRQEPVKVPHEVIPIAIGGAPIPGHELFTGVSQLFQVADKTCLPTVQ